MHKEWGHTGMIQTKMKISPYYTAKNLEENIKKICRECDICVKNKSREQGKFGLMSQLGPATKAFEIVSIDTIGEFGGTRSTKKYIHFTRYAFILTSKTQNANDFIKLVESLLQIDKIETILTDQYPGLNSKEFIDYVKKKNMQLIFTAVNAPFSNDLNERLNQTLINRIRWFTPEYLLHGTDTSNIPRELRRKKNGKDWVKDKKLALERTLKSHNSNKNIFDRNRKDYEFKVGDKHSQYIKGTDVHRKLVCNKQKIRYATFHLFSSYIVRTFDPSHRFTASSAKLALCGTFSVPTRYDLHSADRVSQAKLFLPYNLVDGQPRRRDYEEDDLFSSLLALHLRDAEARSFSTASCMSF
ncbi:hypothetical protein M0804_013372 [Polistes exclamans]|nr:hypothetical protein M0804_013372 [Polistes exclamans]